MVCRFDGKGNAETHAGDPIFGEAYISGSASGGSASGPKCIDRHCFRQPGNRQAHGLINLMAQAETVILGKDGSNFYL